MRRPEIPEFAAVATVALSLLVLATTAVLWGQKKERDAYARAVALTGGDPARGEALMTRYGCAGCHTIPGVPDAKGHVGPALDNVAARTYLGGVLLNQPENLIRWLQDAPALAPGTAMPRTGASEAEARDMAAFLYTRG